jgi:hypothetical protein
VVSDQLAWFVVWVAFLAIDETATRDPWRRSCLIAGSGSMGTRHAGIPNKQILGLRGIVSWPIAALTDSA